MIHLTDIVSVCIRQLIPKAKESILKKTTLAFMWKLISLKWTHVSCALSHS